MDQQNKTDNEIMNVPADTADETAEKAIAPESEKDAEFAQAVARANEILGDDDEEAPAEHVPTAFEKKMQAIPENRWNLYQIIAGILIGAYTVYTLFSGQDSSFSFIIALVLALIAPGQFEKSANRKLLKLRIAMCITLTIGIVGMIIYSLVTGKLSSPTA